MDFTEDELKNRAKAQKDDPEYNQARSNFQKEREAIEITGEEQLRKDFDEFQLASGFGMKEEAEQKLAQIRNRLQTGRGNLEEGGKWDKIKKEMMSQILGAGHYQVDENATLEFNLLKNLLRSKFGEPYEMKGTVRVESNTGTVTFGNGKVTFIPGTSFMGYEFKGDGNRTQLYVGRYEQKLIDAIKSLKEQEERQSPKPNDDEEKSKEAAAGDLPM